MHLSSGDNNNGVPTPRLPATARRRQLRRGAAHPGALCVALIALAPYLFSCDALALPLGAGHPTLSSSSLQKHAHQGRAGGDDGSSASLPPEIWAPILVVAIILTGIAIVTWSKRTGRGGLFAGFARGASVASGANASGTRELTAEQLAGTINGGNATNSGGTTAAGRARRNRRPRRTPSQISTVSLPAYNKEPGEQELVIFRGPEDMEDATIPTARIMPSVAEDGEGSLHSRDNSQASRYSPMPITPNNVPFLHEHTSSTESTGQPLQPPGEDMPGRRSYDTMNSTEEGVSLARVNGDAPRYDPDPRGDAPAYFEVVDLNQPDPSSPPPRSPATTAPNVSGQAEAPTLLPAPPSPPPASAAQSPQRRSGFRTLFNAFGAASHRPSAALPPGAFQPAHARNDSGPSILSSEGSHGREASRSRASHRPSQSGSGSLLSNSPFRTLSRQKSTTTLNSAHNPLTSPSLISLNSISSPLTHTLVRTEFTYPKAGPTPDQLKLISSRETFARFGKPYGADAIAFAASASRQDLEPPPPEFDATGSDTHLPRPAAGPSRLRSTSNAAEMDDSDALSLGEAGPTRDSTSPNLTMPNPLTPQGGSELPAPESPVPAPVPASETTIEAVPQPKPSPPALAIPGTPAADRGGAPSPAIFVSEAMVMVAPPSPASFPGSSLGPVSGSGLGRTTPTLSSLPPSSFNSVSPVLRSESRASSFSMQSFATAAETMEPPTPTLKESGAHAAESEEPETPTTPRVGGRGVREVDAAVTPPLMVAAAAV